MNFFERQEASRRATRRLMVQFVVAVSGVIVAVNLACFFFLFVFRKDAPPYWQWIVANPGTVATTTVISAAFIGFMSWCKSAMLSRGGGAAVARSLGGVRVSPDTTDPEQKRLLNVVEEMAIASGVPMPAVYLLEQERGINAFAAGHNPANAAIAVTRGALETLNRAELQGVIAHEFSHILNGDMRLNIQLMGLLYGLLVVSQIGRYLLFFGSRTKDPRMLLSPTSIVAGVMWIAGYIGLISGRMIQAAVSREREALADASAVQFTRDPTGLRDALIKIRASSDGSAINSPKVDEVAHMLFAAGLRSRLFATHPSLEERIKAIDPHFDPEEVDRARAKLARLAEQKKADEAPKQTSAERLGSIVNLPGVTESAEIVALVGHPDTIHLQLARDIRKSLPDAIVSASRHPQSGRALMLALALDSHAETREQQKALIGHELGYQTADRITGLLSAVDSLEPEQRMPALLGAIPVLYQLTRDERQQLMSTLNGMLQLEGRVSLLTYVLRKLAQVHLNDELNPVARVRQVPLSAVHTDIQVLFSVLAQHGHSEVAAARHAYEAGVRHLLPRERPSFLPLAHWRRSLDLALTRLDQLAPIMKEPLVEALVRTVTHDQQLTLGEAELLRAVCATLHCPLPPLVAARESN